MARNQRSQWSVLAGVLFTGALGVATAVGSCGDDDSSDEIEDQDAGAGDGGRPSDAGQDAGVTDGGRDAAADAGPVDPAVPGNDKPTVARVGYYNDQTYGPRVLIEGRDANGDVRTYRMQLLKDGVAASIDPDGEGVLPASSEWSGTIMSPPAEAGFFLRLDPTLVFLEAIDQVIVTVTDANTNTSDAVMSNELSVAPMAGGTCDPRGFNRCSEGSVCAPTTGTAYTCRTLSSVRQNACSAAAVLSVPGMLSGNISTPSRWNAPTGCSNAASNQPDTVVRVRLAQPGTVVLTMVGVETGFDSLLYLLGSTAQACAMEPAACPTDGSACRCEDGDGTLTGLRNAVLRLPNLPAGDHYVAIDSSPQPENTGLRFQLTAALE